MSPLGSDSFGQTPFANIVKTLDENTLASTSANCNATEVERPR
jgi:hypothetical protein